MKHVTLYSTSSCHLCEQAHAIISDVGRHHPDLIVSVVDIIDSDVLMARYGVRIPVACVDDRELAWPFSLADFKEFLE